MANAMGKKFLGRFHESNHGVLADTFENKLFFYDHEYFFPALGSGAMCADALRQARGQDDTRVLSNVVRCVARDGSSTSLVR